MTNFPLPRIDLDDELRDLLLPFSRFKKGKVWKDPEGKHKIGCLDATNSNDIKKLFGNQKARLAIQDPPYNFIAFQEKQSEEFADWCKTWIRNTESILEKNAALYIWLGADQNNNFQPLADFILMMKDSGFASRSFITMRNQRGYGTQKNWMSIRQELLYYTKGKPEFNVLAEYTDIPKVLKGYYKNVNGKKTDNTERSKSQFIRAGNVWIDIQQVFYRMVENVNGCYAQKPLKSIDRIINASSEEKEIVTDFFSHSGTTLISAEKNNRRCFTFDLDPVFCEITLRRLQNYRKTGKTGWQNSNPFEEEIMGNKKIKNYLKKRYQIEVIDKPLKQFT
ncbi:MAG TPA: site-specific DNA-methyltransferase [Ignavibacteriaceae bacterium]|nr:site-specific DNA-methyltransferase [Ignavibacteriaceae bacterium]